MPPKPKYKIGDVVLVTATWESMSPTQSIDQVCQGQIVAAYIYSDAWHYQVTKPDDATEDIPEDQIIQKL